MGAAEAVCITAREMDVLDGVASLIDNSLLRHEHADFEPRFTMLETVREFALGQLEASGEAPRIRGLHAEHYLALAEFADQKLRGPEQAAWLNRLEEAHDNLRSALEWSLSAAEGGAVTVSGDNPVELGSERSRGSGARAAISAKTIGGWTG